MLRAAAGGAAAHRRGGVTPPYDAICPDSPEWYAQMAAFPLPACDGPALQRRLWEEYRIEVTVIDWNGRQLVRVSVQGYNSGDDAEALVAALAGLSRKATEG